MSSCVTNMYDVVKGENITLVLISLWSLICDNRKSSCKSKICVKKKSSSKSKKESVSINSP